MKYSDIERDEMGRNIKAVFKLHPELLGEGYRYTKTGYRDVSRPILLFKDYYAKTGETVLTRETIGKNILLDEKGNARTKSDVVQTGVRTMQDFLFMVVSGNEYILTHQFFDWVNLEQEFYDYFIDQIINIRDISEFRNVYNALLCMFHEWIIRGYILDFSTITDVSFVKLVKSKKERIRYCEFVKNIYGFEGNVRKDPSKKANEGNYCPDILQRVRTVFIRTGIIEKDGLDKNGIKKYVLTEKGIRLLCIINKNIGIIISGGNLDECTTTGYIGVNIVDAPKVKKTISSNKGKKSTKQKNWVNEDKEVISKNVKDNAKLMADYLCELEKDLPETKRAELFIERVTGKNYVEGHHFIPLEYAKLFEFGVDVEANIVCVCPRCHRLLHHGLDSERKILIEKIYMERKSRLEKCRLNKLNDNTELTLDRVFEFYKIG